MVAAGIEKISLYAGRFALSIEELARSLGQNPDYPLKTLMCHERTVLPPFEDAVTLAVNAATQVVSEADREDIELLIVATESSVDFAKPVANWVHKFCNLGPNCRSLEMKHACYGGTGALRMAHSWVASGMRPGKKALVISADHSRSTHREDGSETIMGASAVASLISAQPAILTFEPDKIGYWTKETDDVFRPTSRMETGDVELSLFAYMDALDGAYEHFQKVSGGVDYQSYFKKHIYHVPFPGMAAQAHRSLMARFGLVKKQIQQSFEARVAGGLGYASRIGSSFSASTMICLMGHLASAPDLEAGDAVSIFSYGSGCQGEMYSGLVGAGARERVAALGIDRHLDERLPVSVAEYEEMDAVRDRVLDSPSYDAVGAMPGYYDKAYAGRSLLVLDRVEDFRRKYRWS